MLASGSILVWAITLIETNTQCSSNSNNQAMTSIYTEIVTSLLCKLMAHPCSRMEGRELDRLAMCLHLGKCFHYSKQMKENNQGLAYSTIVKSMKL